MSRSIPFAGKDHSRRLRALSLRSGHSGDFVSSIYVTKKPSLVVGDQNRILVPKMPFTELSRSTKSQ